MVEMTESKWSRTVTVMNDRKAPFHLTFNPTCVVVLPGSSSECHWPATSWCRRRWRTCWQRSPWACSPVCSWGDSSTKRSQSLPFIPSAPSIHSVHVHRLAWTILKIILKGGGNITNEWEKSKNFRVLYFKWFGSYTSCRSFIDLKLSLSFDLT